MTAIARARYHLASGNRSGVICHQVTQNGPCGAPILLDNLIAWAHVKAAHQLCAAGHTTSRAGDWDGETINPGNETYFDDELVSGATFWHATKVTGWLKAAQSVAALAETRGTRFYVHVGNRRTAEAVIPQCRSGANVGQVPVGVRENKHWVMYELRLAPGITVAPRFVEDGDFDSSRFHIGRPTRYVNEFELPGDISLVVDPRHLVVAAKKPIRPAA